MQKVDRASALCILVVTDNGELSREVSRFLNMAGYRTLEAAQPDSALRALDTGRPEIVLLDAKLGSRDQWALCHAMSEHSQPIRPFKFLLIREPSEHTLREAFEAGFDDVLLLPVCYGELLARLRAAARVTEFDRRADRQEPTDAVTGLWSRSAFTAQLRRHWSAAGGAAPCLACVLVDVDFFAAVEQSEGIASAQALLTTVAQELNSLRGQAEVLGCFGADRFAVMLPGANADRAAAWAERVRLALTGKSFPIRNATCQITVSIGVASCDTAQSADELLRQAAAALASAKASGRNRVSRWGEFAGDTHESNAPGRLFESTLARDVLTPCTVLLHADEPAGDAAALMRQTDLEAVPVVDKGGKLVGLCQRDHLAEPSTDGHATQLVRHRMTADVRRFSPQEDFATMMDYFSQEPLAWAVVVNDGRPVGTLNCDSLLALSQPASTLGPATRPEYSDSTEYLLVPDVTLQVDAEPETS